LAPAEDGKTKLDHAREMFDLVIHSKQLAYRYVLMDTWYATRPFMLPIERPGKLYYCPIQDNRKVDESDGSPFNYQRTDALSGDAEEKANRKNINVKDFPKSRRLQVNLTRFS
jgi:hypothetical protein